MSNFEKQNHQRELRKAIEEMPVSQIREIANDAIGLDNMIPLWLG